MRELLFSVTLDDCEVQTFRAGGKGGQNQNKRDTGVRVIHRASGARGEARDQRSQLQNKKSAFHRMARTPTFTAWVHMQTGKAALSEAEMNRKVEQSLYPRNLKWEGKDEHGNWVEIR